MASWRDAATNTSGRCIALRGSSGSSSTSSVARSSGANRSLERAARPAQLLDDEAPGVR